MYEKLGAAFIVQGESIQARLVSSRAFGRGKRQFQLILSCLSISYLRLSRFIIIALTGHLKTFQAYFQLVLFDKSALWRWI